MIARVLPLIALCATPASAQVLVETEMPGVDSLRLADVRAAAERVDPRQGQRAVLLDASRRRLANLRAERLPAVALSGQATWQDDVAALPLTLPGVDMARPPHEQFRVQLEAEQILFDGGRLARRADIERARASESLAAVDGAMLAARDAATEVFFGLLLLQSRIEALDLGVRDLEARLDLVQARVRAGAALHADAAMVEAELIRLRQQRDDLAAEREIGLEILSDRIGRTVGPDETLVLPVDLLGAPTGSSHRPELERLRNQGERALAEAGLAAAGALPDVRLFGQAGVGRPDPFVPFNDESGTFGLVGVRVRWSILDWGRARREAQVARAQAAIAEWEAEALDADLRRAAAADVAEALRKRDAWGEDERAVSLREEVLRVARVQFDEGVLLTADYVDRLTDLLEARLTLQRRRIEAVHAYARALSTLGRFPGEYPPDH